jgi:hypothetical protein
LSEWHDLERRLGGRLAVIPDKSYRYPYRLTDAPCCMQGDHPQNRNISKMCGAEEPTKANCLAIMLMIINVLSDFMYVLAKNVSI